MKRLIITLKSRTVVFCTLSNTIYHNTKSSRLSMIALIKNKDKRKARESFDDTVMMQYGFEMESRQCGLSC